MLLGGVSSAPRAFMAMWGGANIGKAIVVRCLAPRAIFAHCVPSNGADEQDYVVNKVVDDIMWLGY